MPKKKQKKQSRIIQFMLLMSVLGLLILYIIDVWQSLFIVQIFKTVLYSFLAMTLFAGLLQLLFGGKDGYDGEIML